MFNNLTKFLFFTKPPGEGRSFGFSLFYREYFRSLNPTRKTLKRIQVRPIHGIPPARRSAVPRLLLLGLFMAAGPFPSAECRQSGAVLTLSDFRGRLQTLLADTTLVRSVVGLKIVRLDDTLTIAEMNSGKLLHPASNMKLFTTAAALTLLSHDFFFRTRVYCDPDIDGADLHGNLYVTGGGDPLLDTLDIDSLAGIVAASGIRHIEGDIVGDLSLFDTLSWGKGWMWDDEPDPDEAFITPLSFNHASVSVTVRPGSRTGAPLVCEIAPAPGLFIVDNVSGTLPEGKPDSLVVTRARGAEMIVIRGTMSLSSPPETTTFSVRSPAFHFLQALRDRLAARGIDVEGGLLTGETAGPVFLGQIGRPLGTVLQRINKFSDNLAAESLLKVLAAEMSGAPGSSECGLAAVRSYLSGIGIDPRSVITADGSGVSWYNAVTPDNIIAVLRDQYSRKSTFGEFYGSLARAGYDGTLGNRMNGTAASGRIMAKTGTLTGVATLSGYVTTLSHDLLAFSIMVNHFPGKIQELRSLQDSILGDLVRLNPDR